MGTNTGPEVTAWPNNNIVSIPLTDDEIQVVFSYRRIKPYGSMKVAKNQNGSKVTITVEDSIVVEVKNQGGYGSMNP